MQVNRDFTGLFSILIINKVVMLMSRHRLSLSVVKTLGTTVIRRLVIYINAAQ